MFNGLPSDRLRADLTGLESSAPLAEPETPTNATTAGTTTLPTSGANCSSSIMSSR